MTQRITLSRPQPLDVLDHFLLDKEYVFCIDRHGWFVWFSIPRNAVKPSSRESNWIPLDRVSDVGGRHMVNLYKRWTWASSRSCIIARRAMQRHFPHKARNTANVVCVNYLGTCCRII